MKYALITGCSGLIGSEAVEFFLKKKFNIIGIDNNFRKKFFGPDGSTDKRLNELKELGSSFTHYSANISSPVIKKIFQKYNSDIKLIVHCAAQPSHDWAKSNPLLDFNVNAYGTLNLLESFRIYSDKAVFIHVSTNKVYGDAPNLLSFKENKTRYIPSNKNFQNGIDEKFTIDNSIHSLFGCSKLSGDIYAQEYGKNMSLKTGIFRGGCLTGPNHSGVKLHGFLSFLIKSIIHKKEYEIIGYGGKQVRDNIHSKDLIEMFWEFYKKPRPGEVYNVGGGKYLNCSILEAINLVSRFTNIKPKILHNKRERVGDHKWYISNLNKFMTHYPKWKMKYNLDSLIKEIIQKNY